jgi:hypothetical protein
VRVAAHLIVGGRDEPFLESLLESLVGAVDVLIVNDNAPDPSPHTQTLAQSRFGRHGMLIVDRSPFVDFAGARNACLRVHAEHNAGDWVAFVDADEVHGSDVRTVAHNLPRIPEDVDFVDGYTWHFFQSPDWYLSIERRMAFFRYRTGLRWEGAIHEHLGGHDGKRIALPYVYGHYGQVLPRQRDAEKGRLYSSFGQSGVVYTQEQVDRIDIASYYGPLWPRLLKFRAEHPPAARTCIARLHEELAPQFADTERVVRAAQPWLRRQRNALVAMNYEQRWRSRVLNPLAQRMMSL